ncbi:MAG: S8 family peptidase [Saprospiraceae bacterium]|nr:S8 family peptidase [Saprospiraceae bacterium]
MTKAFIQQLAVAFFLLMFKHISAQSTQLPEYAAQEVIVKLALKQDIQSFINNFNLRANVGLSIKKAIIAKENIFLLHTSATNVEIVAATLKQQPNVIYAHPNYKLSLRDNDPSDPYFSEQWDMEKICMSDTWNTVTGGLSADGDTIVVAIIDSGFYPFHEDLEANIWRNQFETPNDGIDNDGNNYVDDYYGLNVKTLNDAHQYIHHGTAVAGIVGAAANNGKGISGVNWKVKLMLISGVQYISEIRESYEYVAEQRRRYNNSGGQQGAFVVATNASFGISGQMGADYPLWCDAYNILGELGVVSIGATDNANVNVDVVGDLPSTCPSPYLITVTNTTRTDMKFSSAGYGVTHIDLGAPGEQTYTVGYSTNTPSNYGTFGGTSAATPHVTGVAALLYSIPSQAFIQQAKTNPTVVVANIKKAILDGTDQLSDLQNKTVTGGRLNACKALTALRETYGGTTVGDLAIVNINPTISNNEITIQYETPNYKQHTIRIFNSTGQMLLEDNIMPPLFGSKKVTYNTKDWAAGVYFATIGDGSKKVVSKQFVLY